MATARSAQLWQQMRALSAGIRTARIDPTQFGLQPARPGVSAFLEALQEDVDSSRLEQKKAWAVQAKEQAQAQAGLTKDAGQQAAAAQAAKQSENGHANGAAASEEPGSDSKAQTEQQANADENNKEQQQEKDTKMDEG